MNAKLKIIQDLGRFGLAISGILWFSLGGCAAHQPETNQIPKPQGNRTTVYVIGYELPVFQEPTLEKALVAAQREMAGTRDSIIRWKEDYYTLSGHKIEDIRTFLSEKTPSK